MRHIPSHIDPDDALAYEEMLDQAAAERHDIAIEEQGEVSYPNIGSGQVHHQCEVCDGAVADLGWLGTTHWVRCIDCGTDQMTDLPF